MIFSGIGSDRGNLWFGGFSSYLLSLLLPLDTALRFYWILFLESGIFLPISVAFTIQLEDIGNLRLLLHLRIPSLVDRKLIQVDVVLMQPLPPSTLLALLGALLLTPWSECENLWCILLPVSWKFPPFPCHCAPTNTLYPYFQEPDQ